MIIYRNCELQILPQYGWPNILDWFHPFFIIIIIIYFIDPLLPPYFNLVLVRLRRSDPWILQVTKTTQKMKTTYLKKHYS